MENLIIFDLDGVLVDTSQSYDEAIRLTVKAFAPNTAPISRTAIEQLRQEGGFNDDWDLTCELLRRQSISIPLETLVPTFQSFYVGRADGKAMDGLITQERWLLDSATLERLVKRYRLAIFTGRPRSEAEFVLKRNSVAPYFADVVAREDVTRRKPDPEGILLLRKKLRPKETWYVGDSVDDAKAAVQAQVHFLGILPPACTESQKHRALLLRCGALKCLENVNQIEGMLL